MSDSFFCLIILYFLTFVTARPRISRQTGFTTCPVKEQLNSPGTIVSPLHPGPYPNNSTCTWIIAAPSDAVVWLEFNTIDIKSGPSCGTPRCKCDYVQIRGGKKTRHRIVEKFCGGHLPKGIIRTSSSRVHIRFVSDSTEQGIGFSLKFWFVRPRTSPPVVQNITRIPSQGVSVVSKQATRETKTTAVNVIPPFTTKEPAPLSQTTTVNLPLVVGGRTKPEPPSPKKMHTNTTEVNYAFAPVPSEKYTAASRSIKARRTTNRGVPNNNSVPVIMFLENKEEAKKAEEEADPPDAIVLGPAIPIILIFIGVVLAIAWWKFRSDKKERLRYYKEQIRYEEISKRKKLFKKKQSMREMRTKRLYSDMTRSWQGRSQTSPSPLTSRSRRTFAGRLLELAEKPVSYIKTPRSSRPSSMNLQEQSTPLVVMRERKDRPENASRLDPGNRPPSRPASMLLRDALNMIFGATQAEPTSDSTSETPKDSGSGNTSKRASKRVSFYDVLVEKMAEVKEGEDEGGTSKGDTSKLTPLSIPHIMVRQPSCDSGDDLEVHKRSPSSKSTSISEGKGEPASEETTVTSPSEPAVQEKQASRQDTEPTNDEKLSQENDSEANKVDATPDAKRPRSFDKKLVEMLEELQQEGDERERDNEERDELEEPSPPPVPHQTPDPRDSASTSPTGRVVNCSDLEDFLLNLDREMEEDEEEKPHIGQT